MHSGMTRERMIMRKMRMRGGRVVQMQSDWTQKVTVGTCSASCVGIEKGLQQQSKSTG
jgi:hypothetical protein